MNRIAPIVLFAAVVWALFGFIRPQLMLVEKYKVDIEERKVVLNDVERVTLLRDALIRDRAGITQSSIEKMERITPETVDGVLLVLDISNLALDYGLDLSTISYEPPVAISQSGPAQIDSYDSEMPPPPSYVAVPFRFSLSGSYGGLVSFLRSLERSVYILDVTSLTLVTDGSVPAANTDSDQYRFQISANTYQFIP